MDSVTQRLRELIEWKESRVNRGAWETYTVWEALAPEAIAQVEKRVRKFSRSLRALFAMEVPLIRVEPDLLDDDDEGLEPPLAVLFKRIGTNGTALSDADYAYSIIKNRYPQAYELVESLHGRRTLQASFPQPIWS